MDTLYLVFKHRFQIVFGFALQTQKLRPKQTRTLTYQSHSVKPTSNLCWGFFLSDKSAAILDFFQGRKATVFIAFLKTTIPYSSQNPRTKAVLPDRSVRALHFRGRLGCVHPSVGLPEIAPRRKNLTHAGKRLTGLVRRVQKPLIHAP